MKTLFLTAFVGALVLSLAGCGDGSSSSAPAAAQNTSQANNSNPVKAPIDYAQKKASLAALSDAVRQYNVQEGHYPQDLQALTPNYIAKIPVAPSGYKWSYDATAGTVTMVEQ